MTLPCTCNKQGLILTQRFRICMTAHLQSLSCWPALRYITTDFDLHVGLTRAFVCSVRCRVLASYARVFAFVCCDEHVLVYLISASLQLCLSVACCFVSMQEPKEVRAQFSLASHNHMHCLKPHVCHSQQFHHSRTARSPLA